MAPLQLADELTGLFPELQRELHAAPALASLTAQLARFAAFTHRVCLAAQFARLERCFAVADRLLASADTELVAAFRDAYYAGLCLEALPNGPRLARQLMPATLFGGYVWYEYAITHR